MEKLFIQSNEKILPLSEVFDMFLRVKQCTNLSEYTISYYERCFKSFGTFYDVSLPCKDISLGDIQDYILYLKEKPNVNDITINTNLRGVRAILYYAMEMGYLNSFKIRLIRAEKKIKETYTDEELELLLSALPPVFVPERKLVKADNRQGSSFSAWM